MTVVNSDFSAALLTNFQAIFNLAFGKALAQADYLPLCLQISSDSDKENLNFLEAVPSLTEWKDSRIISGLRSVKDYEVKNLNWQAAISVDMNTLEDDKYQLIASRIRQLSVRAANHPTKLVFELINAGASTATYDGVNFFDASRSFGDSGTINNIAAGAYAADSTKIRAGIAAAVALIRGFKDDRGEFLGLVPDSLLCSPAMEIPILTALQPSVAGVTTPEASIIKHIVVNPYLTSGATPGHDFYVAVTTDELKPLVLQMRRQPQLTALDKPDSPEAFMSRQAYYGVDYRGAVALLEPRCMVQVDCSD